LGKWFPPQRRWGEEAGTDVYRFGKSDGGRTVFSVERNGKPVLQSGAAPARPVLEVRGTKFDANDLRTTRLEGSVPTYKFDREVTAKLIRPPAPAFLTYTLDGSEPTATSPVAEKTVTLDRSVTVTAAAFLPDGTSEARNRVQFQLVKIPEAGLISSARFENWDGKAGATTLDKASTIWIAPGAVAEDRKNGRSIAVHRASAGDGLKPGLDVNVSRGPILAGLKVSGLRMRDNAITVGVRFKSDTADGKLFGKDGYNTFGKSYRTVSCSLQKGRLQASPGKISGGQVKPGEWNQVVLTADASAARLYLNGKLVGQGEGSQTLVTDALDFFSNHPAAIDEIRIYERVLTDEDIRRWNDVPHQ
jgi:hypothetical protein